MSALTNNPGGIVLLRVDRAASTHTRHPRHRHAPLDLKYIQAALSEAGHRDVSIVDGWLRPWSTDVVLKDLLQHQPQIVVIRAMPWCGTEAVALARGLKSRGVITLAMGPFVHPANSDWHQNRDAFDVSVCGEGEQAVAEALLRLRDGAHLAQVRADFIDALARMWCARAAVPTCGCERLRWWWMRSKDF